VTTPATARFILVALSVALTRALPAQGPVPMPPRPSMGRDADTNDAQAYYQWAVQKRAGNAHDAFHWASRLEPNQTTYLFARFHALLTRESGRWQEEFWRGSLSVRRSRKGQLLDSLRDEVMHRDPYAYVVLPCPRLSYLTRERNPERAGVGYWSVGCYQEATVAFGAVLERDPSRLDLLLVRAQGFYITRAYDSTVASLTVLIDSLRARDATHLVRAYESKAMFEFMAGIAHERREDIPAARDAYGRALTEDLGMAVAHQRIARIAKSQGDTAQALAEFETAVSLRPQDAVLRFEFGTALLEVGRHAEAEAQLREAARLEPYWPVPQFNLGAALRGQAKIDQAIAAYEAYVALAPGRTRPRIDEARRRIAELRTAPGR
jgi:Tfp pilus assembly protein PilF